MFVGLVCVIRGQALAQFLGPAIKPRGQSAGQGCPGCSIAKSWIARTALSLRSKQGGQQALGSSGSGHKKKRARKKETREGRSSFTSRVSPSRAPVLSFAHYFQAPATQANSARIQRISIWETNRVNHWIEIYPSDSVIHLLNDWGLVAWQGSLRTKLEWTQEKTRRVRETREC